MQIRFYALCLAAPWCLCTLRMYERIRECSGARVCLGCATKLASSSSSDIHMNIRECCVCICLFVCECLTAITHVALLRLVTESTYERATESATKESIGTKRRFFSSFRSLLSFFFLKIFFLAAFLAFSLQRFKYRISRVSGYCEYDKIRLTICCCCKAKIFLHFHIWSPMTSYPIRWSGLWTNYVAISTSVHTYVRTHALAAEWGAQRESYD